MKGCGMRDLSESPMKMKNSKRFMYVVRRILLMAR
jgi:hypothetical protein|uniref:Uncharacterized protein n=1 Tax=Candidatus Methanogaster sp. ANME-2c ERB4 TaxID=2759911 RepID=A0A7G9YH86_9EURY|nr:hypothetical protein LNGCCOLK_00048 [Methanosarcinales archaeon ANME-2c ERB4]